MKCVNCGTELAEDLSFCTNCGTPVAVTDAAQVTGQPELDLGSSLASAVEANQEVIDEIESHGEIADEAAVRWAETEAEIAGEAQPPTPPFSDAYQAPSYNQSETPEAPAGYQPPSYGQPAAGNKDAAAGAAAAAAGAASAPFYQQDVSPNAHYSSQRSYDQNPYGQDTGQPAYQQPSYSQDYSQPSQGQAEQKAWEPQSATKRAFCMTLYVAGLIGLIFGLAVRDKGDAFVTHHLNNVAVITIGALIASILSAVFIGVILGIYLLVMAIMGIVSAYNGNMEELPLIGKIHIVK